MIELKYKYPHQIPFPYRKDIEELKSILNKNGYNASDIDIYQAWLEHSEDWCAGWLMVDLSDESNLTYLLEYLKQ